MIKWMASRAVVHRSAVRRVGRSVDDDNGQFLQLYELRFSVAMVALVALVGCLEAALIWAALSLSHSPPTPPPVACVCGNCNEKAERKLDS